MDYVKIVGGVLLLYVVYTLWQSKREWERMVRGSVHKRYNDTGLGTGTDANPKVYEKPFNDMEQPK